MWQFARQRIGRGFARRRNIENHRARVVWAAYANHQASSRAPRVGWGIRAQPGCIERCPIGLERFRHHRCELVAGAEHPHGPISRQGIELTVHDGLDTIPAPCLGETCVDGCALRAHHDQHLLGTERLRQGGRDFEWAQPAIDLKLRIDLDALRGSFQIEAHVSARPVGWHRDGSGLDTLVGLDDHRNVQREETPGLHLRQRDVDALAVACRVVEFQFRRPDILDPLIEERPQIET